MLGAVSGGEGVRGSGDYRVEEGGCCHPQVLETGDDSSVWCVIFQSRCRILPLNGTYKVAKKGRGREKNTLFLS